MRRRVAEIGQNSVAEVLREIPFVALDDFGADGLVPGVEIAQIFGIEALGKRCGTDNIGEKDSELPPLRNRRLLRIQRPAAATAE
jgi:hypothetical protein